MSNEIIIKSKDEDSFFLRTHYYSPMSKYLFNDTPEYNGKPVKILQIMKIEDGYLLIECAYINK
jgi:hypothetical protein